PRFSGAAAVCRDADGPRPPPPHSGSPAPRRLQPYEGVPAGSYRFDPKNRDSTPPHSTTAYGWGLRC
ncbi:hypothetical protein ACFU53_47855, partial [Streptomyces sp. NPDC057474]|uniref:hypothetical protein n=1 Tax=Streptomyces sp. NPDC057474 TaxID=3346144 RepID=UPI0036C6B5F5